MSETTEPTRRAPAVSVSTTITDSLGRTLEVKKLDALALRWRCLSQAAGRDGGAGGRSAGAAGRDG